MMSSEEANMKFKPELQMLEISLTENLLKEHKPLRCNKCSKFNKDQLSVPNTFLRAKIDKPLHLENHTISKTEKLSDQKIMTCKTLEAEAISKETTDKKTDKKLELNTEEKKTDQEEELNLNNKKNNNSNNNSLNPKALDKNSKEKITCRALLNMIIEELMQIPVMTSMKDKKKEIVRRLSGMIDKEVNLEVKRVLNSPLEL